MQITIFRNIRCKYELLTMKLKNLFHKMYIKYDLMQEEKYKFVTTEKYLLFSKNKPV